MVVLGYLASLLIGVSLGLIGGGGSILTVPVLVYLFGIDPVLASAYSLFIVGMTSLVGTYPKYQRGEIHIKTAVIFGIPAIAVVYATRAFLVPAIPQEVFTLSGWVVTRPLLLMIVFALLMLFASFSMIRDNAAEPETGGKLVFNYPMILLEGAVVGVLTGLVGAGGGFLIIPALVLFIKLPMKQAVGTSLLIIAAKSLFGFTGDLQHQTMDWQLLLSVTVLAIAGIFIGNALNKKVSAQSLKKGFGWFVLVMGLYILVKEIFYS